ncbi:MAG TPA: GNAT family N-acetyltransferase [Fimbriimonadaceae bacterium]|nr:GNAT family N-acetyltransferase [Fimbriimonadaceae bacterium]HRJ34023.1 GNAT family N-acetyltransferase [Fimbriimonadaceae bacterium]
MKTLQLEDVVSLAQWERAVKVLRAYAPDQVQVPERAKNYARSHPDDKPIRRMLLVDGGQDRAFVVVLQAFWFPDPGLYICDLDVPEAEYAAPALDVAEQQVLEFGGSESMVWFRSDRPYMQELLVGRGYTLGQVNPVIRLDLGPFNPEPWASKVDAVLEAGYEIIDLESYGQQHPETWKHDLWRMEMDLLADVPLPEPFVEEPYEDFVKGLDANPQRREFQFFALWEGVPVAMSALFPNYGDPTLAHTGLTGSRREHRRKGLATALKAKALTLAKEAGIQRVYTDNEENNPMRELNLALGFRDDYQAICSRRKLVNS